MRKIALLLTAALVAAALTGCARIPGDGNQEQPSLEEEKTVVVSDEVRETSPDGTEYVSSLIETTCPDGTVLVESKSEILYPDGTAWCEAQLSTYYPDGTKTVENRTVTTDQAGQETVLAYERLEYDAAGQQLSGDEG